MLLSIFPEAHVAAPVWPLVDTVAVLFVVMILAFVQLHVCPNVLPEAMHVPTVPLSYIVPAIFPLDHAEAVYFILVPLAVKARAIGP